MANIAAVILAAGGSSRFGRPKQLLHWGGKSFLRRLFEAASTVGCQPVAVVVGSDRQAITKEITQTGALIVHNECWRSGIGTSIRTGLRHVIESAAAPDAIILLACDQPFVNAGTIEKLIALWKKGSNGIVASSYGDTLGIPALFDREYFDGLLALNEDRGAKEIILKNREFVEEFSFPAGKIDIDTVDDYEQFVAAEDASA